VRPAGTAGSFAAPAAALTVTGTPLPFASGALRGLILPTPGGAAVGVNLTAVRLHPLTSTLCVSVIGAALGGASSACLPAAATAAYATGQRGAAEGALAPAFHLRWPADGAGEAGAGAGLATAAAAALGRPSSQAGLNQALAGATAALHVTVAVADMRGRTHTATITLTAPRGVALATEAGVFGGARHGASS
jgi:hypothetical protein